MIETDRLIAPEPEGPREDALDRAIRPKSLDEYVGQKVVREQMRQEYNEYKVCERALTSHSTNSTNVRCTNEMFAGA